MKEDGVVDRGPYETPAAVLTEPAPANARLYSPDQVGVAAFLGAPIAAGWLLAHNYKVFGALSSRRRAIGWGVAGTVGLLAVSLALPQRISPTVIPVAYSLALRQIAKVKQGSDFSRFIESGATQVSWWKVVGIGLGCLTVVLTLGTLILGLAAELAGERAIP